MFTASELPKAMLASAVLSPLAIVGMAQGLARLSPHRLVPGLYGVSGAAFVGEYFLSANQPKIAAGVIYLHVAVLGALLVSGFWSVVSERFDPHTAKNVIGRITAGATSGGLIGGLIAERVAAWMDARMMLIVLAGMSVLCAATVWRIGDGAREPNTDDAGVLTGLRFLKDAPYLKMLGALVVFTALISGVVDYAFKAEAAAAFPERESLMTVFAIFYTTTGVVTFLAQTLLSRRLLMRLGIGGTIALLPGSVMLAATIGASVTRLWSVVAVRAIEEIISNSLYRSGYELLFTPLSPERKRPTKTLIDVGFKRIGDALGSGLVMAVVFFAPALATRFVLGAAAVAGALSLGVALYLHRGYVAELASSLLDGRIVLDDADVVDATTRRTLADTTMAINREQLLAQIEELRATQAATEQDSIDSIDKEPAADSAPPPVIDRRLLDAAKALASGDNHRVRRALRSSMDPSLVGFALPLLGDDNYGRAARRALRQVAPRAIGSLVDAMVDDTHPEAVRRRLPDIIASVPSRRAAAGLFEGIVRGSHSVRDRCVKSLADLVVKDPDLKPQRRHVVAAVQAELAAERVSISRVFALLGLALDPEPLQVALSGLRSDDTNLQGTSYEYLENVVPEAVRAKLWPHLEAYAVSDAPPSRVLQQSVPAPRANPAMIDGPSVDD